MSDIFELLESSLQGYTVPFSNGILLSGSSCPVDCNPVVGYWKVTLPTHPNVWRCWKESSLCILSAYSSVRTLRLTVCHVNAFHLSNLKLLTSCSGVVSLLLSFLCSSRFCFPTGCAKFNCASERVTFKPGGRRTRFLSTPCLALCV